MYFLHSSTRNHQTFLSIRKFMLCSILSFVICELLVFVDVSYWIRRIAFLLPLFSYQQKLFFHNFFPPSFETNHFNSSTFPLKEPKRCGKLASRQHGCKMNFMLFQMGCYESIELSDRLNKMRSFWNMENDCQWICCENIPSKQYCST